MNTHPYVIRLTQLSSDLPRCASTLADPDASANERVGAEARIALATAIATSLPKPPDHIGAEPSDLTQALGERIRQGYSTAYCYQALTTQALDHFYSEGRLDAAEVANAMSGHTDATPLVEEFMTRLSVSKVLGLQDRPYYLSTLLA